MKILWLFVLVCLATFCRSEWVKEMENEHLFQGDIVLDPDQKNPDGSISYAAMVGGRWPNGVVPYQLHMSLQNEPKAVQAIKDAIADYHKYTCIRWVPRTTQQAYVEFYHGSGCSSPVGHRTGRTNHISLAKGCWHKGTTMHEMGHSLGFWHEQSRPDRDDYIQILWDNIMPSTRFNFEKQKAGDVDDMGTGYDLGSMMHYGTSAFSRNRKRTIKTRDYSKRLLIGQRRGASDIDVKRLNLMYKCPAYKGTVPPKVCTDEHGFDCKAYARKGYCSNPMAEQAMYRYCCGTCFGDELKSKRSHTWPHTTSRTHTEPVGPTKPGTCVDMESKATCKYWASLGKCTSGLKAMREFMHKHCCATCRGLRGAYLMQRNPCYGYID